MRNFQLDNYLTCGLDLCDADVALFIASDLEELPELIPLFLQSYERGHLHVAGKLLKGKEFRYIGEFLQSSSTLLCFAFLAG